MDIQGQWYIFYHRQTNGCWYSRPRLRRGDYYPAGRLHCTSGDDLLRSERGPLQGRGEYPAYIVCNLFTGEDHPMAGDANLPKIIQDGCDGDENNGYITNISDGTVIGYKTFDCRGVRRVTVTTRGYANGSFDVKTAWDGPALGSIPIKATNHWQTFTADITVPDGLQALYFAYRGSKDPLMLKSFTLEG